MLVLYHDSIPESRFATARTSIHFYSHLEMNLYDTMSSADQRNQTTYNQAEAHTGANQLNGNVISTRFPWSCTAVIKSCIRSTLLTGQISHETPA